MKAVTIRLARIAITEVHFNARAPVGQGQHFIAKPMHRAVFAGVQKVHRAHRLAAQAMQHAQHGRQTDAAAEQHHRPWTLLVQHKGAGWACDVEYVANPHAVVQVVGTLSGRQVLAIERGGFTLDRNSYLERVVREGTDAVVTQHSSAVAQHQPHREELPRTKVHGCRTVLRREDEGGNDRAFRRFLDHPPSLETLGLAAHLKPPLFAVWPCTSGIKSAGCSWAINLARLRRKRRGPESEARSILGLHLLAMP